MTGHGWLRKGSSLTFLYSFYSFFNQIDQFKMNHFLWVTAGGMKVAQLEQGDAKAAEQVDQELDDEDEDPEGGDG